MTHLFVTRHAAPMALGFLQKRVPRRGNSSFSWFRHLGALGLFFLAILDSSPVPTFAGPDILIAILAASHRNPWFEYAAVATAGSLIGALFTYRIGYRAGSKYLQRKFGRKSSRPLKLFSKYGAASLAASSAVPFPFPTSAFFAAAGATKYPLKRYVTIVGISRAVRYTAIALLADHYGRQAIRLLRHPQRYWGWLLLFFLLFVAVIAAGIFLSKRLQADASAESTAGSSARVAAWTHKSQRES